MDKMYPRAYDKRRGVTDPQLRKSRSAFLKAAVLNLLLYQLLFLGLFCWIFGSLFQQTDHTHNINILFVDYDNGAVGAAVREAYGNLQGPSFPSLVEGDSSRAGSPEALEEAVCRTDYWAALYVTQGSSARLQAALTGGSSDTDLDKSDILTYIWNEASYSAVVDSVISSNIQRLSTAARVAYTTGNGTARIQELTSPDAISVFADPWHLTSRNIQPTTQGSRAIYNTLVIILILVQEFFYLGALNGLYVSHRLYSRLPPKRMVIVRDLISLVYCLVGSVCTAGAIWAFRAGWDVDGKQFVLVWMALWLFAHINFLQLDVFTVWIPPAYVPMALISWIIFNVASILLPFELSPGFYRIGYAAPAHEVYQILIDIWSRGCNPQLRYALPILFAWWLWGLAMSGLGVYRRAHYAVLGEEQAGHQFQERLDAAVQFEKQREKELKVANGPGTPAQYGTPLTGHDNQSKELALPAETKDQDLEMRNALAGVIARENSRIKREQSRESQGLSFGPTFTLPFGRTAESDQDE